MDVVSGVTTALPSGTWTDTFPAWSARGDRMLFTDPKGKLVMILMIQSAPARNALRRDFENAVMQSIVR